jgi:hypothetical protein
MHVRGVPHPNPNLALGLRFLPCANSNNENKETRSQGSCEDQEISTFVKVLHEISIFLSSSIILGRVNEVK